MGSFRLCTGSGDPANGSDEPSAYGWPLSTPMQDGVATITREFYFTYDGTGVDYRELDPSGIFKSTGFPVYGAKLYPGDTGCHYNYHGNGTLEHFNPDSKYWVYRADYVYSKNRSSYRRDKAPWESPPSNVSISFPETVVPFRAAYDASNMRYMEGNVTLVPVANSAGDLITAETHNYAIQLSFSYCLEPNDFSLEKVFFCNHSVNKNKIKVCGITFNAESAMITNLSPQYHEETTDSSQKNTYKYWEIGVTIQADTERGKFRRVLLDIGNRALWPLLYVHSDGSVTQVGEGNETSIPRQIYSWMTFDRVNGQMSANSKSAYGHKWALAKARDIYIKTTADLPEFQFEKMENMPLKNGRLYLTPIQQGKDFGKYQTRSFREYEVKAWGGMNMPKKGVDW